MFFAAGTDGNLYSLERNGSLYRIDPKTGALKQLGKSGEWGQTVAGTIHNGVLYTVETSGKLYATSLADGSWKQLGKAEFGNTRHMAGIGGKLYTIEASGRFYEVTP